jgi:hypothetical protein
LEQLTFLLHDRGRSASVGCAIAGAVRRKGIDHWRRCDRTFEIPDFSRILIIVGLLVEKQENSMRIEQKLVPESGWYRLVVLLRTVRSGQMRRADVAK